MIKYTKDQDITSVIKGLCAYKWKLKIHVNRKRLTDVEDARLFRAMDECGDRIEVIQLHENSEYKLIIE